MAFGFQTKRKETEVTEPLVPFNFELMTKKIKFHRRRIPATGFCAASANAQRVETPIRFLFHGIQRNAEN